VSSLLSPREKEKRKRKSKKDGKTVSGTCDLKTLRQLA
jgi:hypothetical protein